MNIRDRFYQFMSGRYGADELSKVTLGACLVFMILNLFLRIRGFYLLAILLLVLSYFRMLSRDYARRSAENQKYLQIKRNVISRLGLTRRQIDERKVYHIYRCPNCRQKIRIPRGKGNIIVTCPKCRHEFSKRA